MRKLSVLYDPHCGLCEAIRGWMLDQRSSFQIDIIASGSERARLERAPGSLVSRPCPSRVDLAREIGVDRGGLVADLDALERDLHACATAGRHFPRTKPVRGDVQTLGRAPEMQLLGDGDEVTELAQFHAPEVTPPVRQRLPV